jgi:hypothetical protein
MIWVALAAIGVPLWLCAAAILTLILRNRSLRRRPGNVPVRVRGENKHRWSPGHGVWIHDVFAFRGLPAAWREALVWASDAAVRIADDHERKGLHRVGDSPVVVTLTLKEGGTLELAASSEHKGELLGPFASPTGEAPVAAPR